MLSSLWTPRHQRWCAKPALLEFIQKAIRDDECLRKFANPESENHDIGRVGIKNTELSQTGAFQNILSYFCDLLTIKLKTCSFTVPIHSYQQRTERQNGIETMFFSVEIWALDTFDAQKDVVFRSNGQIDVITGPLSSIAHDILLRAKDQIKQMDQVTSLEDRVAAFNQEVREEITAKKNQEVREEITVKKIMARTIQKISMNLRHA